MWMQGKPGRTFLKDPFLSTCSEISSASKPRLGQLVLTPDTDVSRVSSGGRASVIAPSGTDPWHLPRARVRCSPRRAVTQVPRSCPALCPAAASSRRMAPWPRLPRSEMRIAVGRVQAREPTTHRHPLHARRPGLPALRKVIATYARIGVADHVTVSGSQALF